MARLEGAQYFLVRQGDARCVALLLDHVEREACTLFQHHRRLGKGADAQFRSLQVGEDGDRPADFLFQRPDRFDIGGVGRMFPVAHVHPESVDTGTVHFLDHFRTATRRTKRRQHLDFAVTGENWRCHVQFLGGALIARCLFLFHDRFMIKNNGNEHDRRYF